MKDRRTQHFDVENMEASLRILPLKNSRHANPQTSAEVSGSSTIDVESHLLKFAERLFPSCLRLRIEWDQPRESSPNSLRNIKYITWFFGVW